MMRAEETICGGVCLSLFLRSLDEMREVLLLAEVVSLVFWRRDCRVVGGDEDEDEEKGVGSFWMRLLLERFHFKVGTIVMIRLGWGGG